MAEIRLLYFDGCPHWRTMQDEIRVALRAEGMTSLEPILVRVETDEDAERLHFTGSPTILIDGRDPFGITQDFYGLSCRVYDTPFGRSGTPTVEQIRSVLRSS